MIFATAMVKGQMSKRCSEMGRSSGNVGKSTTGKFATEDELKEAILRDYYLTGRSMSAIARACGVSAGYVSKWINNAPHSMVMALKREE